REIQAVDPDALSDEELVAYIKRCRDHHAAMITQHMRFTASAVVPTGDFLAHVGDWTGLPPAELLGLMRGAAPVSAGGSDALLRSIRIAAAGRDLETAEVDERIAGVRAKVPEEHRGEFDELLGEARLLYRLRDERGIYSDIWASGLMRRAALAAGRRMASRMRIHDAEHLVDAGVDEMSSLLTDSVGPSADELLARFQHRTTYNTKE